MEPFSMPYKVELLGTPRRACNISVELESAWAAAIKLCRLLDSLKKDGSPGHQFSIFCGHLRKTASNSLPLHGLHALKTICTKPARGRIRKLLELRNAS
mmetsp:Transcript_76429/g.212302  ORF Transcript_76429/g.212302 Transcript_76429/m.212302 type:complete len:99 (-) Transcript_76429:3-299(-)